MSALKYLAAFLLVATIVRSSTIFSSGLPSEQISIDGDEVVCGSYVCPKSTTTCIFRKKNNHENPKMVDVIRQCLDKNGVLTGQSNYQFEIYNGEQYNSYVKSGTSGNNVVLINDELDPAKREEIERRVQQITDDVNREVSHNVNQAMQTLQRSLSGLDKLFQK